MSIDQQDFERWKHVVKVTEDMLNLVTEYYFENDLLYTRKENIKKHRKNFKDRVSAIIDTFKSAVSLFGKYSSAIPFIDEVLEDKEEGNSEKDLLGYVSLFNYKISIYDDDYGQQFYAKFKFSDGKEEEISNGSYNLYLDGILFEALECIKKDLTKKLEKYLKKFEE